MLAGQCLDACGAAVAVTAVVSGRRDPQASARTWARAPAASRSSRYPPSSTPTTGAGATLVLRSGPRIPGILVHGHVADRWIPLHQRLGAVPVVHVPVLD